MVWFATAHWDPRVCLGSLFYTKLSSSVLYCTKVKINFLSFLWDVAPCMVLITAVTTSFAMWCFTFVPVFALVQSYKLSFMHQLRWSPWYNCTGWLGMKHSWINVHSPVTEFDHPEVTLCSWQDVKIQLITNWISPYFLIPPLSFQSVCLTRFLICSISKWVMSPLMLTCLYAALSCPLRLSLFVDLKNICWLESSVTNIGWSVPIFPTLICLTSTWTCSPSHISWSILTSSAFLSDASSDLPSLTPKRPTFSCLVSLSSNSLTPSSAVAVEVWLTLLSTSCFLIAIFFLLSVSQAFCSALSLKGSCLFWCHSPWYNRNGWLGVKHQVTYSFDASSSTCCHSFEKLNIWDVYRPDITAPVDWA